MRIPHTISILVPRKFNLLICQFANPLFFANPTAYPYINSQERDALMHLFGGQALTLDYGATLPRLESLWIRFEEEEPKTAVGFVSSGKSRTLLCAVLADFVVPSVALAGLSPWLTEEYQIQALRKP